MKRIKVSSTQTLVVLLLLTTALTSRSQSIYVSTFDNTILKFAPDGSSSVFASGLSAPEGLAFDGQGNLYVANYGSSTIMKFTPNGVGSVFASTGLLNPIALAIDKSGNLYVSNEGAYDNGTQQYHSYIEKFTAAGVGSLFADATANGPDGLACDSAGNLYAAYRGFHKEIMKFTPGGAASIFASTSNEPQGLAFDTLGTLYASYGPAGSIEKFSSSGTSLGVFASGMPNPVGMALDSSGNLYTANFLNPNGNVEKTTPGGVSSVFAANLHYPTFIAIIPEPASWTVLALGLGQLLVVRSHGRRTV